MSKKVKPSKLGQEATELFDQAVQKELAELAAKGIPTLVIRDGKRITAIPKFKDGRWIVEE